MLFDVTGDVPIVRHDVLGMPATRAPPVLALPYDASFADIPQTKRRRSTYPGATIGDGLEVRASTIAGAGNGLFADRDFVRNEIVTKYDGPIAMVPATLPPKEEMSHWASLIPRHWVVQGLRSPIAGRGGGSFINHVASRANTEFVKNNQAGHAFYGIYIKARRAIKKGEEIFLTYGRKNNAAALAGVRDDETEQGEQGEY